MDPAVTLAMTITRVRSAVAQLLDTTQRTGTGIDLAARLIKELELDNAFSHEAMPKYETARALAVFQTAVRAHVDKVEKPNVIIHPTENLDGAKHAILELLDALLQAITTADAAKFTCTRRPN